MIEIVNEPIFQYLSQFAYSPLLVYGLVILIMYASSFGLPFPEEVTLLSIGLLAFMGSRPDLFPPPTGATDVVRPLTAAVVATFAVFSSDVLVFFIGRKWGFKILRARFLSRLLPPATIAKAEQFTEKHGAWAAGAFRFTPALRFPGHLLCGALGLKPWKFLAVDGLAVLVSVPTQVLLMAYYGEQILVWLKRFKILVFVVLGCLLAYYIFSKLMKKRPSAC